MMMVERARRSGAGVWGGGGWRDRVKKHLSVVYTSIIHHERDTTDERNRFTFTHSLPPRRTKTLNIFFRCVFAFFLSPLVGGEKPFILKLLPSSLYRCRGSFAFIWLDFMCLLTSTTYRSPYLNLNGNDEAREIDDVEPKSGNGWCEEFSVFFFFRSENIFTNARYVFLLYFVRCWVAMKNIYEFYKILFSSPMQYLFSRQRENPTTIVVVPQTHNHLHSSTLLGFAQSIKCGKWNLSRLVSCWEFVTLFAIHRKFTRRALWACTIKSCKRVFLCVKVDVGRHNV